MDINGFGVILAARKFHAEKLHIVSSLAKRFEAFVWGLLDGINQV